VEKANIPLGLYIHFPWCISKCPYCDFNSHAVKGGIPETKYVETLLSDLQIDLQLYHESRTIRHIFFGGGTPSLFSPEAIDLLLNGIKQQISLAKNIEITLEANPGTFESGKFAEFKATGINRLSIGVQSFNDQHLNRLGRGHSAAEAIKAAETAHYCGFENFNLDLMFGLPDANPGDSNRDIETAISLQPTHISFYQLTLEPNTYFHKFPPALPNDDAVYVEQSECQQLLADNNYVQYEISAYAQHNFQCRHNLNYWQFGDYLGIGAGAHGKITAAAPDYIIRTQKEKNPQQYILETSNKQHYRAKPVALKELPLEFIMNHLRLKKGFTLETYSARTGLSVKTLQPALAQCIEKGLICHANRQYYCSEKGWDFLDDVLNCFLTA
jgi:putative oxygen-independent coproporphyrinogen III oxidase